MQSKVRVVLRNPLRKQDMIDYTIQAVDTPMAHDWYLALQNLLQSGRMLEKNYCFMGFPKTARDLSYLCNQLNQAVATINAEFDDYKIEEHFTPDSVRVTDYAPDGPNHEVLNRNSTELSSWDRMGKSKKGIQGVNMWIAGENFLIINDDDLSVAVPFFEKYLSSKFKP